MKEQIKAPEKRQLSDKEIANLSDGEFKALVNQNAHRTDWTWSKMKEQMKNTQNEIKQNILGTNSDGKETRTQINGLEQKEEINIQP